MIVMMMIVAMAVIVVVALTLMVRQAFGFSGHGANHR